MKTQLRVVIRCGCGFESHFQWKSDRLQREGLEEDLLDDLAGERWEWYHEELICPDCVADLKEQKEACDPYFTLARDLSRLQAKVAAEPRLRRQE